MEKMIIRGVAKDTNVARISLMELADVRVSPLRCFLLASRASMWTLSSVHRSGGHQDISFTVSAADKDSALGCCENQARLGFSDINCDDNIAKVSIVSATLIRALPRSLSWPGPMSTSR